MIFSEVTILIIVKITLMLVKVKLTCKEYCEPYTANVNVIIAYTLVNAMPDRVTVAITTKCAF
jgi:hypothetical protein